MAMLKKSKELAKRTHQSTSVANQFLKDMCKRKGVRVGVEGVARGLACLLQAVPRTVLVAICL